MPKSLLSTTVMRRYRNRVRECRLRALIAKQEELVRRTGIHRTIISLLENNHRFLSAPYALLIAEALGCRLDDLYERTDGKAPRTRKQDTRGCGERWEVGQSRSKGCCWRGEGPRRHDQASR